MKTLYILRHAKSSWDNPDLDDHDRPLNSRGEKDAPRMGKRLRDESAAPALICSSPAARAYATASLVAKEINYPEASIQKEKQLYHAGEEKILKIIHTFGDKMDPVMIVGHNPGLTDFVNRLLNEEIDNIPTTGVIGARLKIDSWSEASWGCGEMFLYEYPKKGK